MKLDYKITALIKVLLIISCPFFTLLLSTCYEQDPLYFGVIISFMLGTIIISLYKMEKKVNKKYFLLSIILALFTIKKLLIYCSNNTVVLQKIIYGLSDSYMLSEEANRLMGFFALPFTTFLIYKFLVIVYPKVKNFFKKLNNTEKRYLQITLILSIIITLIITKYTSAFVMPFYNHLEVYDVIYNTDTSTLVNNNAFLNVSFIENDVRQPLFGFFALPFGIIASLIADLCFFIKEEYSFGIIITIIQFILTSVSIVLMSRLLKINEKDQKYFFLLIGTSFTYLIFSLLVEQYIIALFYLILAVYYHFNNPKKTNYLYVGALGTLVTSGIIFPFISKIEKKKLKKYFLAALKCFGIFFCLIIISGQFPQFFTTKSRFMFLTKFLGKVSFSSRVYQYTHFLSGTLIPNAGHLIYYDDHPSYLLKEFTSISLMGLIVFGLCTLSFVLNSDNKFIRFCYYWIILSFLILFVIGWGIPENGLILYNPYFAWAFISLIYKLIMTIIKDKKRANKMILYLSIFLFIVSAFEIERIISFAIKFYGI